MGSGPFWIENRKLKKKPKKLKSLMIIYFWVLKLHFTRLPPLHVFRTKTG